MTAAQASTVQNLNPSTDTEVEEFHAITRVVIFARESAENLDAHQTVYCLDLALEQIAAELRHRADNSGDISSYFDEPFKR